ncbi:MAG TPA: M67 family metallopeptidase [Solirubrobacteraceae bacterium]|nr:M67 family metallopeptidase [Solirubrobacteraceae bacterium]
MDISSELLDEVIAHALEDPTNEVCGVVAVEPGPPARATRVYRATNVHASPLKFEIHPDELLKLWNACQQDGCDLGAIYHSHVRSKPYPSQTDVNFAASWPGVEWIIVGLSSGAEPEVRSYLIEGAEVREVALEVR